MGTLDVDAEDQPSPGFAVIYKWRIEPSMETEFIQAWTTVTTLLKQRGSLGARLHRGADGLWYSYAQWPSAETRQAAFAQGDVDQAAQAVIQSSILESFPEVLLESRVDLLASCSVVAG